MGDAKSILTTASLTTATATAASLATTQTTKPTTPAKPIYAYKGEILDAERDLFDQFFKEAEAVRRLWHQAIDAKDETHQRFGDQFNTILKNALKFDPNYRHEDTKEYKETQDRYYRFWAEAQIDDPQLQNIPNSERELFDRFVKEVEPVRLLWKQAIKSNDKYEQRYLVHYDKILQKVLNFNPSRPCEEPPEYKHKEEQYYRFWNEARNRVFRDDGEAEFQKLLIQLRPKVDSTKENDNTMEQRMWSINKRVVVMCRTPEMALYKAALKLYHYCCLDALPYPNFSPSPYDYAQSTAKELYTCIPVLIEDGVVHV